MNTNLFSSLSVLQLPLSSCLLLPPPAQAKDEWKFLLRPVHFKKMSYRLRNRGFMEDSNLQKIQDSFKGIWKSFMDYIRKTDATSQKKLYFIVTSYLTMGWENQCVLYYCELRPFFFHTKGLLCFLSPVGVCVVNYRIQHLL